MAQLHFSPDTLEKFLKAELSRRENQDIVRHLLRRCPACLDEAQLAIRRQGLKLGKEKPALQPA